MHFYYFFRSEAWRKKARWRAVWQKVRPYALSSLGISLVLHIYILPFIPLLLLLFPAVYYLFEATRPSVFYTWNVNGLQFFCAVYFDKISLLDKNGVMISGCGKEIFRKAKIRRCKNLDENKMLLVKIADTSCYMLYNAEYVNGLSLGKTLENVNYAQKDSFFIKGSTISFVMNSGTVFFMPQVNQYKIMNYLPKYEETQLTYTDFFTGKEPKPIWQTDKTGNLVMNFGLDFPYVCYLAIRQKDETEMLLQVELSCVFIKQVLLIKGIRLTPETFNHPAKNAI